MRKDYKSFPIDEPDPVTNEKRIWVPMLSVHIGRGHNFLPNPILAVVDSGSPYCLFRADIADALKINMESGKLSKIGGVKKADPDPYYFHRVKLKIEKNWIIEVYAGFSKSMSLPALLGRTGFYDHFYVTFDQSVTPPALEIEKIDRVQ